MLVYIFCALLVTHGRLTYRQINGKLDNFIEQDDRVCKTKSLKHHFGLFLVVNSVDRIYLFQDLEGMYTTVEIEKLFIVILKLRFLQEFCTTNCQAQTKIKVFSNNNFQLGDPIQHRLHFKQDEKS